VRRFVPGTDSHPLAGRPAGSGAEIRGGSAKDRPGLRNTGHKRRVCGVGTSPGFSRQSPGDKFFVLAEHGGRIARQSADGQSLADDFAGQSPGDEFLVG
jgi:hypothetical protein